MSDFAPLVLTIAGSKGQRRLLVVPGVLAAFEGVDIHTGIPFVRACPASFPSSPEQAGIDVDETMDELINHFSAKPVAREAPSEQPASSVADPPQHDVQDEANLTVVGTALPHLEGEALDHVASAYGLTRVGRSHNSYGAGVPAESDAELRLRVLQMLRALRRRSAP